MLFQRWEKELVEGEPWDIPVNRVDWSSHLCDRWEMVTERNRNIGYKSKICNVKFWRNWKFRNTAE